MDDPVVVQVLATQNSMAHEVSGLGLRHCLPPLVQFKERLEAKKEIKQQNLEQTGTSNIFFFTPLQITKNTRGFK